MSDINEVLKYIWINCAQPNGEIIQGIPNFSLENMLRVSRQYSSLNQILWVDYERIKADGLLKLESDLVGSGMKIKNLRDIPAYTCDELFDPVGHYFDEEGRSTWGSDHYPFLNPDNVIWRQVDLAKILVLHHCLSSLGFQRAFYSDFDIVDPKICSNEFRAAFDSAKMGFSSIGAAGGLFENGAMGFDSSVLPFLEDVLLPATQRQCHEFRGSGWVALSEAVSSNLRKTGLPRLVVHMEQISPLDTGPA